MKSVTVRRIAATLALSAAFSAGWAQDKPEVKPDAKPDQATDAKPAPTTDAKPAAGEKQDQDTADKQDQSAEEPAPVNLKDAWTAAYYGWGIGGNRQKLHQYATPANGFALANLSLISYADAKSPFVHWTFKGAPGEDFVSQGTFIGDRGKAFVHAQIDRYGFSDPTVIPTPASVDHGAKVDATYPLYRDLSLFASFRSRESERNFEAPRPNFNSLTKQYAVGVQGKALDGFASFTFDGTTFNDRTGLQPDWTRNRFQVKYDRDLTRTLSLGGSYVRTNIIQSGAPDGRVESYGIDADVDLGRDRGLFFTLRREDFHLPLIQDAFVEKRLETSLRYVGMVGRQRMNLAYSHREQRVLNADHTYEDVPTWSMMNAGMNGRLSSDVRYSATLRWEHFNKGGAVSLDDPFSLYWDDKARAQFRFNGGTDRTPWYATETFTLSKNNTREDMIRSYNALVGASTSLNARTTAFVEASHEVATVQGVNDPSGVSLDQFFPNGTTLVFGVNRDLPNGGALTVNFNQTFTDYVNPLLLPGGNIKSTQLTAQYSQKVGKDGSFGLSLAPWNYTDQLYGQYGYRAAVLGVTFTNKF